MDHARAEASLATFRAQRATSLHALDKMTEVRRETAITGMTSSAVKAPSRPSQARRQTQDVTGDLEDGTDVGGSEALDDDDASGAGQPATATIPAAPAGPGPFQSWPVSLAWKASFKDTISRHARASTCAAATCAAGAAPALSASVDTDSSTTSSMSTWWNETARAAAVTAAMQRATATAEAEAAAKLAKKEAAAAKKLAAMTSVDTPVDDNETPPAKKAKGAAVPPPPLFACGDEKPTTPGYVANVESPPAKGTLQTAPTTVMAAVADVVATKKEAAKARLKLSKAGGAAAPAPKDVEASPAAKKTKTLPAKAASTSCASDDATAPPHDDVLTASGPSALQAVPASVVYSAYIQKQISRNERPAAPAKATSAEVAAKKAAADATSRAAKAAAKVREPRLAPHFMDTSLREQFRQTMSTLMPEKLDLRPPRVAANITHVLAVTAACAHPDVDPMQELETFLANNSDKYNTAGLGPVLREGARVGGKHINLAPPSADSSLEPLECIKRQQPAPSATADGKPVPARGDDVSSLPGDFYSGDRVFMRSYTVRLDEETAAHLRNVTAGVTTATNFLLAVCATVHASEAGGHVMFTKYDDCRYNGTHLKGRLRGALQDARAMLDDALHAGRVARNLDKDADATRLQLGGVAFESAVSAVADSIEGLQKTYANEPSKRIQFAIRRDVPILIERDDFENESPKDNALFSRKHLGRRLTHGLPPSATRVTLRLQGRTATLTYQPAVSSILAANVTKAVARKFQVAVLPGGLRFVPAGRATPSAGTDFDVGDGAGDDVIERPLFAHYNVRADAARQDKTRPPTVLAVDPGSKCFGTVCHGNTLTTYETNDTLAPQKIRASLRCADKLDALAKTATAGRTARFLRDQAQLTRDKLKRFTTHAHRQFAQFIVDKHDDGGTAAGTFVMLPHLHVGAMTRRFNADTGKGRNLNAMTSRQLLSWGHARSRTSLAAKLRFFPSICVLDVNEAYSTKGTWMRAG